MIPPDQDLELEAVETALRQADPDGGRAAKVLRETFDQLYDGQRTGRYRWDQLYKTEKTHCGTLIEINLHREFGFQDGSLLDYLIAGIEVDCKFSQRLGGWMIPPEALGHLCLVLWANDELSRWSMGLVRVRTEVLNTGANRDQKATLNRFGVEAIRWIFSDAPLPPNVLLQMDRAKVEEIIAMKSGQQSLNALFRIALGKRVGRAVVATVAQQLDPMKRVRGNGGARTALRKEGIIILGQYQAHCQIADDLAVAAPGRGESVPVRVVPAERRGPGVACIDGSLWRVAQPQDPVVEGPYLPAPRREKAPEA